MLVRRGAAIVTSNLNAATLMFQIRAFVTSGHLLQDAFIQILNYMNLNVFWIL